MSSEANVCRRSYGVQAATPDAIRAGFQGTRGGSGGPARPQGLPGGRTPARTRRRPSAERCPLTVSGTPCFRATRRAAWQRSAHSIVGTGGQCRSCRPRSSVPRPDGAFKWPLASATPPKLVGESRLPSSQRLARIADAAISPPAHAASAAVAPPGSYRSPTHAVNATTSRTTCAPQLHTLNAEGSG